MDLEEASRSLETGAVGAYDFRGVWFHVSQGPISSVSSCFLHVFSKLLLCVWGISGPAHRGHEPT